MSRKKKQEVFPFEISKIKVLYWYHTIIAVLFGKLLYEKVEIVKGSVADIYKLWNTLYFIPCKVDILYEKL